MKLLNIKPHLTLEEIAHHLAVSGKAHFRSHWQILLTITLNPQKRAHEYAAFLGVTESKIYTIVKKYNTHGPDSIEAKSWGGRRTNVAYISLEEESNMLALLKDKSLKGHILTIHDVSAFIENHIGKVVSDDYIWDLFKRHNWSKKMPRPTHPKGKLESREEFKKNLKKQWIPNE
jgi:transposase